MLTKEKVLQTIDDLPNEFSLDEIVEKLIVLEKIQIGLREVEEGKLLTTEEMKQKLKRWRK